MAYETRNILMVSHSEQRVTVRLRTRGPFFSATSRSSRTQSLISTWQW